MSEYRFGKSKVQTIKEVIKEVKKPEANLRIYCKVAYSRKEKAKKHGGRWDQYHKMWYFEYDANEFETNKYLNTNEFIPEFVELSGVAECIYNDEIILAEGKRRQKEYMSSQISPISG